MRRVVLLSLAAFLFACAGPRLTAPAGDTDWPHYAGDLKASKYADLTQIDRNNFAGLKRVWSWQPPDNAFLAAHAGDAGTDLSSAYSSGGFKSTPIKLGDTLYISTPMGFVAALDARTGRQKWVFDTHTYEHGRPANIGFNHRGVAFWSDGRSKRILIGTNNAFLWSLDAETGLPDRAFGTEGRVDLTVGLGREVRRSMYSVVAAPTVVGDTVVLGSVVFDLPVLELAPERQSDMPPGHVRGFDVRTGAQRWIFHSIPEPGETGHETWEQDSWKRTGSTNVWTLMSADPELGYVYLPFGAPSNDWYGGQRLGDNLFGNSIVCLEAATGKLVWYFQTIHHDLWDYDLPAAPNLVDIVVDGKPVKALAQVSKQGFVYVLDRVTGKPVWPIEERPVPQSDVPGERTAATQPFPSRPAPFEVQGLGDDQLVDFSPELRAQARQMISQYRNDGFLTPPSLQGSLQLPGDGGGAEWSGAGFDPATHRLFLWSITSPIVAKLFPGPADKTEFAYVRGGNRYLRGPRGLPLVKPPYSRISAIDLDTGDYVWVVPNGEGIRQRIIRLGLPDPGPVGAFGHSSPLVTPTLLIAGVHDGKPLLRAFDKDTGATLAQIELPAYPLGAPMSYLADGRQYIVIATLGGPKEARLVALALP